MTGGCFILDASSAIQLCRHIPKDIYVSTYVNLARMAENGRLFSHRLVETELLVGSDEAHRWINILPATQMIDIDDKQGRFIKRLEVDFPHYAATFSHWENKSSADPFLIACAKIRGWTVVTEEGGRNARIPEFCDHYDIPHLTLYDFFRNQGWTF